MSFFILFFFLLRSSYIFPYLDKEQK